LLKRHPAAFAEAGHSCPVVLGGRSARLTAAGGQRSTLRQAHAREITALREQLGADRLVWTDAILAALKRVFIPKPGGKEKRPLGIPTVEDRIVQTALQLVIGPIIGKRANLDKEQSSTGEPDAGDPHVRFGGRGEVQSLIPTPIRECKSSDLLVTTTFNKRGSGEEG